MLEAGTRCKQPVGWVQNGGRDETSCQVLGEIGGSLAPTASIADWRPRSEATGLDH